MEKFDREVSAELLARGGELQDAGPASFDSSPSTVDVVHYLRRPLRCLIDGSPSEGLPKPPVLDFVRNAEDPYDVIILPESRNGTALEELFSRCSNPAAPLIAFSPAIGPRADAVIKGPSAQSLLEALAALGPLTSRVAALPRIPFGAERGGLLALALGFTRSSSIVPAWQPHQPNAIGYPLLAGIVHPRRLLEELADGGLLRRRFFERMFVCEHCDSSRIHAREVCVTCRSSFLAEHPIVHHYSCGTQAAQPAFETNNGYHCPKCRKELRHYGVDYEKPGSVVMCGACAATMAEPEVSFICADCGHQTASDRAQRRDWFEYDLTQDGIDALRAGVLPRAEEARFDRRGHSARDFKMVVRNHISLATRCNRPLSAWRMVIDIEDLVRRVGKPASEEIRQLVFEIALADVPEGDAFVALPAGLVVCRPETTGEQATAQIRAISKGIAKTLRTSVRTEFTVFERAKMPALLDEMR